MENVFNLAFGDINENGEINDYTISDNGDRNKILATVANVVDVYTKSILTDGSFSGVVRPKGPGFTEWQ